MFVTCLENNRSDFDNIVHEIDNEIININHYDGMHVFSDVIYKCSSMILIK